MGSSKKFPTVLLGPWDYVIVVLVILLSGVIGLYHAWKSKKSKNTREFLVANRSFGIIPLIMSMVATYLSPNTMLGQPMETYSNGIQIVLTTVGQMCSYLVAMFVSIPVFYRLNLCTIHQYVEFRFGKFLKVFLAALGLIQNSIITASYVYVTALVLSSATGFHFLVSMASICIICIIYSSLGGVSAVIWTDCFQVVIIFISLAAMVIKGTMAVGGASVIWERNRLGDRTTFFRVFPDANSNYTMWSLVIGNYFLYYAAAVLSQNALQRQMANKSLCNARMTMFWTILVMAIASYAVCWIGMTTYARYADCDPLLDGQIYSRDQIAALFAMEIFQDQAGLYGLFIAGILAATLSTLSSVLNAVSTIALVDFIKPMTTNMSDKTATLISKIIGFLYGGIVVGLTLVVEYFGSIIQVLHAIAGTSLGPTAGVFSLGLFCPWTTTLGATIGYFSGLAFGWWMSVGRLVLKVPYVTAPISDADCDYSSNSSFFGSDMTNFTSIQVHMNTNGSQHVSDDIFPLYTIIPLWYSGITLCVVIVVGTCASFLTGSQDVGKLDPRLISPIVHKILSWLPEKTIDRMGYKQFVSKNAKVSAAETIELEEAKIEAEKNSDEICTSLDAKVLD
ncbi:Sodium-coupled monocarboxylate transporter 1 [Chamberlinius hualienensis]